MMEWLISLLLSVPFSICLALLLDAWLGEPKKLHPLIGFGNAANWVEHKLNQNGASRASGLLAWHIMVLPLVLVIGALSVWLASVSGYALFALNVVTLYVCVGQKSLIQHADWIFQPLKHGDTEGAREKVGWIVSRETSEMTEYQITSATVESVLENGNDAVFGALFWFAILGAPGAVLFRAANTLDAMWGYKNPRYKEFGFVAARLDDAMGYIPARLTALSYALLGNTSIALRCWKQQASACSSPNGGPVMTAGAGALNITIGGPAVYHGKLQDKIFMGEGDKATAEDIPRACKLIVRTSVLWCGLMLVVSAVGVLF
ncbi:adenosylcobinamide-phosphate synthase CbiB [Vibrio nigripulchritudo]|uniref:adenosylcobinamide-phosphate synthase CbiB n=1 Tax=Vibrio nigripulchritudo TaxID=28173 RepID=UPI0002FFF8A5|nr:adenosylcobinamide-phosphate synthase CbiB [Vibrio nigripulchritudo]